MKKIILAAAVAATWLTALIPAANAYTLRGYFRDNGTYVDNYQRGTPDGYCWNTKPSVDSEPADPVLADPLGRVSNLPLMQPTSSQTLAASSEIRNEQPGGCFPHQSVRPNAHCWGRVPTAGLWFRGRP